MVILINSGMYYTFQDYKLIREMQNMPLRAWQPPEDEQPNLRLAAAKPKKPGRYRLKGGKLPDRPTFDMSHLGYTEPPPDVVPEDPTQPSPAKEKLLAAKKARAEAISMAKNLSKIRYFEKSKNIPWIHMLMRGIQSLHGIEEKPGQIWQKLKAGQIDDATLSSVLRNMETDYGTVTLDQLYRILPLINCQTEVGDLEVRPEMLRTQNCMITDDVFAKATGMNPEKHSFASRDRKSVV